MRIVKNIDLTKEFGCTDIIKFIRENIESLENEQAISIIVKGYADEFTITEWAKNQGYKVLNVERTEDKSNIIIKK